MQLRASAAFCGSRHIKVPRCPDLSVVCVRESCVWFVWETEYVWERESVWVWVVCVRERERENGECVLCVERHVCVCVCVCVWCGQNAVCFDAALTLFGSVCSVDSSALEPWTARASSVSWQHWPLHGWNYLNYTEEFLSVCLLNTFIIQIICFHDSKYCIITLIKYCAAVIFQILNHIYLNNMTIYFFTIEQSLKCDAIISDNLTIIIQIMLQKSQN